MTYSYLTRAEAHSKKMSRKWLLLFLPLLFILAINAVGSNPPFISNITGVSMLPTVESGDKAIFKKIFTNDLVGKVHSVSTFKTSYIDSGTTGNLIKRVIAGPGDTLVFDVRSGEWLEINGQKVIINPPLQHKNRVQAYKEKTIELIAGRVEHLGNPIYRAPANKIRAIGLLHYPYLTEHATSTGLVVVNVPEDHYFVMSDNWVSNLDSRYFGPIHKRYLRHRALAIIPKDKYLL